MTRIITLLLSLCITTSVWAAGDVTAAIDRIFSQVYTDNDAPGAAVLILQGNDTIYARCFGVADMQTREPITFDTNFCLASISKQFAAVALLQLQEAGKLSLDDPIGKLLPQIQSPQVAAIPLRYLLCHSSGIPDARDRSDRDFRLYSNDFNSPTYIDTLSWLSFTPGTQYEYINPTFQLAFQIINRRTGTYYDNYIQQHLFDPAGMRHAYYFEPEKTMPNTAHGYKPDGNGGWSECDYGEENFFATKADGALYCSINDFVRWERALAADGVVWSAASREQAYTPHITIPADAEYGYQPNTGYGYGFFMQRRCASADNTTNCPTVVYHLGDNGGFTNYAGKVPEKDLIFLFFSTRPDIDRMAIVNSVLDLLL